MQSAQRIVGASGDCAKSGGCSPAACPGSEPCHPVIVCSRVVGMRPASWSGRRRSRRGRQTRALGANARSRRPAAADGCAGSAAGRVMLCWRWEHSCAPNAQFGAANAHHVRTHVMPCQPGSACCRACSLCIASRLNDARQQHARRQSIHSRTRSAATGSSQRRGPPPCPPANANAPPPPPPPPRVLVTTTEPVAGSRVVVVYVSVAAS